MAEYQGNLIDNQGNYVALQPTSLIEEVSLTEYYIGTSVNGKIQTAPTWVIKKVWKDGTVWNVGFPSGDQGGNYAWTERGTYTYE
jgi:hypothetical protein